MHRITPSDSFTCSCYLKSWHPDSHPFARISPFSACLLYAVLSALLLLPSSHAQSVLDLGEEDFVRGSIESLDDKSITWRHQLSGTSMSFPTENIHRILFSPDAPSNPVGDTLLLDNENLISGKIISIDEIAVAIDSPIAGTFAIPRNRISAARIASSESNLIYSDTGDLKGWKSSSETGIPVRWTSTNGALKYTGRIPETITRSVDLPLSCQVSLEFEWDNEIQRQGQFSLALCSENDSSHDYYGINITNSMVTGIRSMGDQNNPRQEVLGRIQLNTIIGDARVFRLAAVADRQRGRLIIFINDRMAATWNDPKDSQPLGSQIRLSGFAQSAFFIRNLKVETWNGLLNSSLTSDKKSTTTDLVLADDDDQISGRIVSLIRNPDNSRSVSILLSVNPTEPIVIPVSRIRFISFASAPDEESAPPAPNESTLRFSDGSILNGVISSLENEAIRFSTLSPQPVSIPLSNLISIDFPHTARKTNPDSDPSHDPMEKE